MHSSKSFSSRSFFTYTLQLKSHLTQAESQICLSRTFSHAASSDAKVSTASISFCANSPLHLRSISHHFEESRMQVSSALPYKDVAPIDAENARPAESNLLRNLAIMEGASHDAVPLQLPS